MSSKHVTAESQPAHHQLEALLVDRVTTDGPQYIKAKDLTDHFPEKTSQWLGKHLAALSRNSDQLDFMEWGGCENSTTWYITRAD